MDDGKETLPLVEEQLVVGRKTVSDGQILVSIHTDILTDFADIDLRDDTVAIERVSLNTVVNAAPQVRIEGDVTVIPILEERLVVERRLVLVEEIRIRRTTAIRTERVEAELRKQSVAVERIKADNSDQETSDGQPL
jgi:uncharacterized protein (TIGR02271 family)